jgi:pimeloyl-ACP methyl ester carboxylesterase
MSDVERHEEQRKRRRKRLIRGLLFGAAAVGVPALANFLIARRAARLAPQRWGRPARFAWRHGDIVFRRLGEGPPVVLLHSFGLGHDSSQWRRTAELLAEDYTVFVPDLLGWGESDRPAIAYDAEVYLQQIEDFLADVVRRRAVVVAAGLSAAYAARLAADDPGLSHALVAVGPHGVEEHTAEPDLKDSLTQRFLRLPIFGTAAVNLATSWRAVESHLKTEVYASSERVDFALVERHYRSCHQAGAKRALAAFLSGYLNHDVESALRRIEAPVWLAWGREAKSPPLEVAERWRARLPRATLDVFDLCGNLPHAETPGLFVHRLRAFLAALPARSGGLAPGSIGAADSPIAPAVPASPETRR